MNNELLEDFKASESLQISYIDNFDLFTQMVINCKLEKLEYKVIDYIFYYLDKNLDSKTYYHLLRILDKILADDPKNITRVNKFFIDEQLVKKAYQVCPESMKFLSRWTVALYLSNDIVYTLLRNLLKSYRFMKASLKNELSD